MEWHTGVGAQRLAEATQRRFLAERKTTELAEVKETVNILQSNIATSAAAIDEKTREVIDAIQQDGTCWCGATAWQGRAAMRISVSSWATTKEDVEKSLRAMIAIARRLTDSSA